MARKKKTEQHKEGDIDQNKDSLDHGQPTPYAPPPDQGIDYKEKLAYGNLMSELIGLVSFAINRGGNGGTELDTVWMNLLPEIKEELNEFYTEQTESLRNELASIPDGLIYLNEETGHWEDVGNANNKVLDVKALLNPANRGIAQEMIFNNTTNKRKVRQSGQLKHEMITGYVREVIPELINALQNHDLLMQTRKKTEVGAFSMVRKEGSEITLEKDMDGEDGVL